MAGQTAEEADKAKKRKKTHVVRFYGKEGTDSEDFWVDVEFLDRITFDGRQGNVSNKNQAQQTTVNLADDFKDPGRKLSTTRVYNPDDDNQYVDVDVTDTIEVQSRGGAQYQKTGRWFDTSLDNRSRKILPVTIVHNNIDDQYLTEVTDKKESPEEKAARVEAEARSGKTTTVKNITGHNTGRKTLQPPDDANAYLQAVKKTADKDEDQHLDVELTDTYGVSRAKSAQHQAVQFNGMWNNSLLYKPYTSGLSPGEEVMPGSHESEQAGGADPVKLDPLQVVVNFGGGGLAVEFGSKGEDAPKKDKKK